MKKHLLFILLVSFASFVKAQSTVNIKLDTTLITYSFGTLESDTRFKESGKTTPATFFPFTSAKYVARALFSAPATPTGLFTLQSSNIKMSNPATGLIKSSFFNIVGARPIARISFDLDLTSYTGLAPFIMSFGNDDGGTAGASKMINAESSFQNASGDVFGSFRLANTGGLFITQYRNADGTTFSSLPEAQSLIRPGVAQHIDIFINTSGYNDVPYTLNSVNRTMAANTYEIFVNGVKYANAFPKNGSSYSLTNLDAVCFEFAENATQQQVGVSNFAITYSNIPTTLPVSLIDFSGKKVSTGIELNWSTASEQNNDYFEILRSVNGKSYTSIGTIKGKDQTSTTSSYQFLDRNPVSGINYYQLKQVDKDGTVTVFTEKMVALTYDLNNKSLSVYAVQEMVKLDLTASQSELAKVVIIDLQGRKLVEKKVQLNEGKNSLSIEAPMLRSGLYVIKLDAGINSRVAKFLVK
ncbi:hypothetical protein D3C87_411430 [compost metagenome]